MKENDHQQEKLLIVDQTLFFSELGKCIGSHKENMHTDLKLKRVNLSFDSAKWLLSMV